jgi:hypothetical protein
MTVYDLALKLQQNLIESRERPRPVRKGTETKFIQRALEPWGYLLSRRKIQTLAARAKTYDDFIWTATRGLRKCN